MLRASAGLRARRFLATMRAVRPGAPSTTGRRGRCSRTQTLAPTMSHDFDAAGGAELAEIIADFEAARTDAEQLGDALVDFCARFGQQKDAPATAKDLCARVEQLAARVEMMRFNLCRAARRGAVLELIADFRARASDAS